MSTRQFSLTTTNGSVTSERPERDQRIDALIRHFYSSIKRDPLLGPVFAQHITDWESHLSTMRDFWSSAVDRTGRYSGRPLAAHQRLAGLTDGHFERWITLWSESVRAVIPAEGQEPFIDIATRMRLAMSTRLGLRDAAPDSDLTRKEPAT